MDIIKTYIAKIILVCVLIQIASIIIQGNNFKKLYVLFGAIFVMQTLFSFPISSFDSLNEVNIEPVSTNFENHGIKSVFEENVSQKVNEALYTQFGIESDVEIVVSDDFSCIDYFIRCQTDNFNTKEIERFIMNNFCSEKDGVRVFCENR